MFEPTWATPQPEFPRPHLTEALFDPSRRHPSTHFSMFESTKHHPHLFLEHPHECEGSGSAPNSLRFSAACTRLKMRCVAAEGAVTIFDLFLEHPRLFWRHPQLSSRRPHLPWEHPLSSWRYPSCSRGRPPFADARDASASGHPSIAKSNDASTKRRPWFDSSSEDARTSRRQGEALAASFSFEWSQQARNFRASQEAGEHLSTVCQRACAYRVDAFDPVELPGQRAAVADFVVEPLGPT